MARHEMPLKDQAALWRAAARGAKTSGDLVAYQRYARTAAIIERRPWKIDRDEAHW